MKLQFILKRNYGHERYYPHNTLAHGLVALTGRKCLKDVELERLKWSGFEIEVLPQPTEGGAT